MDIRREVDRFLRQQGVAVEVVLEFDNIENIKKAIEIGGGVALLPEPTLRQEVEAGLLVARPLAGCRFVRPLGIIHRRQHRPARPPSASSNCCCENGNAGSQATTSERNSRTPSGPLRERRSDMNPLSLPPKQGLYDPRYEHDACGVGFVVDLKNRQSHDIVRKALQILYNLEHRGACGCEKNTGDGAGILLQMPHGFLRRECAELGIALPAPGQYGVGMVFLPTDDRDARSASELFERIVREEGQKCARLADRAGRPSPLGATAQRGRAGHPADFHRPQAQRGS